VVRADDLQASRKDRVYHFHDLLLAGDIDGTISDVTFFLRPLDVLLAGIERMKALLE
jgi:hypothetical protein